MPKRKKRTTVASSKKKKDHEDTVSDDGEDSLERAPVSKKVAAASSTSHLEDETDQISPFSSINLVKIRKGSGEKASEESSFSSHFWCNYCEFSADSKRELVTHMRQHMIKCSFCPFNSLSRSEVSRHCKTEHDKELDAVPQDNEVHQPECEMDKDPCSACIFCDFMTYSTEHLEKHTQLRHRGMLPKSIAKMISKQTSAEVRKTDALFYLSGPEENAESTPFPSSITIHDDTLSTSKLSEKEVDCKPPASISSWTEEQAEKEVDKKPVTGPLKVNWNVKVETMYCMTCPYSSVSVEKLKCHTISQHPVGATVATFSSGSGFGNVQPQDLSFFCVKEECSHSSTDMNSFCDHLVECCTDIQLLSVAEKERIKSTVSYLLDCQKKHKTKLSPAFLKYATIITQVQQHSPIVESPGPQVKIAPDASISVEQKKFDSSQVPSSSSSNTPASLPATQWSTPFNQESGVPHPTTIPHETTRNSAMQSPAHFNPPPVNTNQPTAGNSLNNGQNTPQLVNTASAMLPEASQPSLHQLPVQQQTGPLHTYSTPQHQAGAFSYPSNNMAVQPNDFQQQGFVSGCGNDAQFQPPMPAVAPLPNSHTSQAASSYPNHSNDSGRFPPNNQPILQTLSDGSSSQVTFNPAGHSVPQDLPQQFAPHQPLPNNQTMVQGNMQQSMANNGTMVNGNEPQPLPFPSPGEPANSSGTVCQPPSVVPFSFPQNSGSQPAPNTCMPMMETPSQGPQVPFNNSNHMHQRTDITNQEPPSSGSFMAQPLHGNYNPGPSQLSVGNSIQNNYTVPSQPSIGSMDQSFADVSQPKMLDLLSDTYSILLSDDSMPTSMQSSTASVINPHEIPSSAPGLTDFPSQQQPQQQQQLQQQQHPQQPPVFPPESNVPTLGGGQNSMLAYQPEAPIAPPVYSEGQGQAANNMQHLPPFDLPQQQSPAQMAPSQEMTSNQLLYTSAQTQQQMNTTSSFNSAPIVLGVDSQPQSQMQQASQNVNQFPPSFQGSAPVAQDASHMPNFLVSSTGIPHTSAEMPPMMQQAVTTPTFLNAGPRPTAIATGQRFPSPSTPQKNAGPGGGDKGQGGVPLSPSIYLSGKAPRHQRSDWVESDMRPRGSMPILTAAVARQPSGLPPFRPGAPAVTPPQHGQRLPSSHPPYRTFTPEMPGNRGAYPMQPGRGYMPRAGRRRGRPSMSMGRGSRNPTVNDDDDVIVTAVTKIRPAPGPPAGQRMRGVNNPRGRPGGRARYPSQSPNLRGAPNRMSNVRQPGPPQQYNPSRSLDVSKHFEDLACLASSRGDDAGDGDDDLQIVSVTPGKGKDPNAPKSVNAVNFSFCCVYCGKDQGSKEVMKRHMKAMHSDSLLGAFRNLQSGQLLFFCPQIGCDFMTYNDGNLAEHIRKCYNTPDNSKLPFDLPLALKNLRALKITQVEISSSAGESQFHPIDLDGQGLRDNFNDSLTDAFDGMVENVYGRVVPRSNAPPRPTRPQRGDLTQNTPPNSAPQGPRGPIRGPMYRNPRGGGPAGATRPYHQGPPRPTRPYRGRGAAMNPSAAYRGGSRGSPGGARMPVPRQPGYPVRPPGRGRGGQFQNVPPAQGPPAARAGATALGNNQNAPIVIDLDADSPPGSSDSQNMQPTPHSQHVMPSVPTNVNLSYPPARQEMVPGVHGSAGAAHLQAAQSGTASVNGTVNSSRNDSSIYSDASSIPVHPTSSVATASSRETGHYFTHTAPNSGTLETSSVASQGNNSTGNDNPDGRPNVKDSTVDTQGKSSQVGNQQGSGEGKSDDYISEEAKVNSILLEKVFAKVPNMPKNLSRRLVSKFKQYATYKGVTITPDSKVIDEFVSKIYYKGSNNAQNTGENQNNSSSSGNANPSASQPSQRPSPALPPQPLGPPGSKNMNHSATALVAEEVAATSLPHSHAQAESENSVPDHQTECLNRADNTGEIVGGSGEGCGPRAEGDAVESEGKDPSNKDAKETSDDVITTQVVLAQRSMSFSGPFANLLKVKQEEEKRSQDSEGKEGGGLTQGSTTAAEKPALSKGDQQMPETQDTDDLPSLDPKEGQGSYSKNVRRSLCPEFSSQDVSAGKEKPPNAGEKSRMSSDTSQPSETSSVLPENNETLVPVDVPVKHEAVVTCMPVIVSEPIVVRSSVEHLVSGHVGLEVDIAGKPLRPLDLIPSVQDKDSEELEFKELADGKGLAKSKVNTCVIDKSTGKLKLKIFKSKTSRKRRLSAGPQNENSCSSEELSPSAEKADEAAGDNQVPSGEGEAEPEQPFVRRSERKRKEVSKYQKGEDANMIDELMSDDDDEYNVDDDDDDYDDDSESERKRDHSNSKRAKRARKASDPSAFDASTRGVFKCWVCRKQFVRCNFVKKHIIQKHKEGLCAVFLKTVEEVCTPELVLFCPRQCKYSTTDTEALSRHEALCENPVLQDEGDAFLLINQQFIDETSEQLSTVLSEYCNSIPDGPRPHGGEKLGTTDSIPATEKPRASESSNEWSALGVDSGVSSGTNEELADSFSTPTDSAAGRTPDILSSEVALEVPVELPISPDKLEDISADFAMEEFDTDSISLFD
ncbi:uncharacterized protein LOC101846355 [Aplysia californica]|uniref:Uncharacterized protein LOC101846355 n=1 Tax=Aplysia californica TaxID=6500 RepID=A0ABM0JQP9_APLCA|nr:uncharacterized protein LOC101846355 [Aplysia californica]